MYTLNLNEINKVSGYTRTDSHFDVMYMAARREHTEAMRRAAAYRLAQSAIRQRQAEAGERKPMAPIAALTRLLADAAARLGSQTAPELGR